MYTSRKGEPQMARPLRPYHPPPSSLMVIGTFLKSSKKVLLAEPLAEELYMRLPLAKHDTVHKWNIDSCNRKR